VAPSTKALARKATKNMKREQAKNMAFP